VSRKLFLEIEQRDGICIVRISGRLATGADADYVANKAQAIRTMGCRRLIVDIQELDSVGSAGLGFFVDLHTHITKATDGLFVLAGPSPRVLEVLTLTGLSAVIPLAADLATGLALCKRERNKVERAGG
jgi:anti-anti-sigma factor